MNGLRAWRLRRAIDKRNDLEHYREKWGWARKPSELRRLDEQITKAQAKIDRLEGAHEVSS